MELLRGNVNFFTFIPLFFHTYILEFEKNIKMCGIKLKSRQIN